MRLEAVRGDRTVESVDAIVNAANSALARGAGVCGAIFAAGGRGLDEACAALGGGATGDAKPTAGFDLPARWVIHAVGPVWHGGDRGDADQLASADRRCLQVADHVGAASVAVPAISTRLFGCILDAATDVAVQDVRSTSSA